MQQALHVTTKVLQGNKLEIHSPELPVGEPVEVFVVLSEKPKSKRCSVIDILEEIHSLRPPKTAEEIDRYLQEERASWDS